jgi:uncharacterized protein (TIGR00730 family)
MADNKAQLRSPSYRLAVEDMDFLLADEVRAFRFGLEYAKAEHYLRQWGVRSTVVVFGSSRVVSTEEAERHVRMARGKAALARAKLRLSQSHWYEEARQFGRIVSQRGGALNGNGRLRDNVIATGGGPGIMEAANRGAAEAGAPSIGFNITLPAEQEPNGYSTPELTFRFHYFAMRKMHLAMRANALAVFPGGYGTLDELFEILTLIQTGKAPAMPIVLFGKRYWSKLIDFPVLVEEGMIEPEHLELFEMVDSAEAAWQVLRRRGLTAHAPEPPGA